MRVENLPSPGMLSNGIALQNEAMKAISAVEIVGGLSGGKTSMAKPLTDFFTACIAAIATFVDVTAPTVSLRGVITGPSGTLRDTIRIRASEMLDPKFVPLPAAFAVTGVVKTISKVVVDGPDVLLTVSVPFATSDTGILVAYTQPGATANLRDMSGNLLASFTAAAVTNP